MGARLGSQQAAGKLRKEPEESTVRMGFCGFEGYNLIIFIHILKPRPLWHTSIHCIRLQKWAEMAQTPTQGPAGFGFAQQHKAHK